MVPVIGLLILILAVVLFQVFRSLEGFQLAVPLYTSIPFTEGTTMKEAIADLQRLKLVAEYYKDLLPMVKALPEKTTFTQKEKEVLYPENPSQADSIPAVPHMISLLESRLQPEEIQKQIENAQKELLRLNLPDTISILTFVEKLQNAPMTPEKRKEFLEFSNFSGKLAEGTAKLVATIVEGRFPNYKKTGAIAAAATAPTAAAATAPTAAKANMVDVSEIFTALQGYKPSVAATASAAPVVTETALKELENRIQSSVGKLVKDEMLAQRSFAEKQDTTCSGSMSTATAQGAEYQHTLPPAPAPDMSQYIRKDSIPCWGCTLPS